MSGKLLQILIFNPDVDQCRNRHDCDHGGHDHGDRVHDDRDCGDHVRDDLTQLLHVYDDHESSHCVLHWDHYEGYRG